VCMYSTVLDVTVLTNLLPSPSVYVSTVNKGFSDNSLGLMCRYRRCQLLATVSLEETAPAV
jgi:hypothetical protein